MTFVAFADLAEVSWWRLYHDRAVRDVMEVVCQFVKPGLANGGLGPETAITTATGDKAPSIPHDHDANDE